MSSALDITKYVNPPRAVFLDYPLGHTAGPPRRPDIQLKILEDALKAFSDIQTPGTVISLPFVWPDNPDWKIAHNMLKDERTARIDTPQYQNEEDRIRAEKSDLSALAVCGCAGCRAIAG
jgi:hypothetical protein